MTITRAVRIAHHRLRSIFRQDAVDQEVSRELAFHFDQLVAEQIENGRSPDDARRAARHVLGNAAALQEACRDHRRVSWLHDLCKDALYGWRTLVRDRRVAVVAVASLALGLGATSAALSALGRVIAGALPYPSAERLVVARTFPASDPSQLAGVALDEYFTWVDRSRSFEQLGIALGFPGDLGADERGAPSERVDGCLLDDGMLAVLGVQPRLGRSFTATDPRFGTPGSVILISDALWTSRYLRDPSVVGKTIRLNRANVTVIGVMPPGFFFPHNRVDYWGPLRPARGAARGERLHNVVGRLRPGVRPEDAAAELQSLSGRERGVRVRHLRDAMLGWALPPLATVGAAAVVLLLMACANVAALLLARGTVRGPELALRVALGAGRGRIVRQLIAESVVLAMAGAVLSLLVAWLSLRAFGLLAPLPGLASIPRLTVDLSVVLVTTLLALVTGVGCGVMPAVRCSRVRLCDAAGGWHKMTGSAGPVRLRTALVAAQLAASFVLLVSAALLAASFVKLANRHLNYDPSHLVTFDIRISPLEFIQPSRVPGEQQFAIAPTASASLARVFERVRAVPGVAAVGGISHHPTNSFALMRAPLTVEGSASAIDGTPPAYFVVTPKFFAAMKTPLVSGREFAESDTPASPWVAVVNDTLARRLWPGQHPIGRRIRIGISADERPREIVGVVRDIPTRRAQLVAEPVLYTASTQQPPTARPPWLGLFGRMTFVVRTTAAPADLVPTIRRAVADVEPDLPLASVASGVVEPYMWSRHSYVFVIGIFAIVATLVASFGVYGVMSYAVAQRSREIAIRVALGARPRDVLSAAGRHALTVVAAGLATGIAASLAATRLLSTQLWGVSPTDPTTFAGIAVLLTAVAGFACLAPVRKAIRVDGIDLLKES